MGKILLDQANVVNRRVIHILFFLFSWFSEYLVTFHFNVNHDILFLDDLNNK